MSEQGMRSEDLCGKFASRGISEGARNHAPSEIVGLVGYALGGLPGERLLNRLGIKSSGNTVLRASRGEDVGRCSRQCVC